MRKEICKGGKHNEIPRDPLGGRSSLSSPHQSSNMQLSASRHSTLATTGTADRWKKRAAPCAAASATTGMSIQAPSLSKTDMLKFASVVQQIMTDLSEAVPEKDKIMVVTKMVKVR
jgi:hypothetical protein